MYGILGAAGYGNWPIIKQIAWLLGQIMNLIFNFLDKVFGIQNIGLCIIIFTVIVYTLMIPLTIKQQKFSKMSAVMNPEIQKLQKKYAGKRDQASQMKMQEEMNLIYEKYGTSPTGGCLPMLIQFVSSREDSSLDNLISECTEAGKDGIMCPNKSMEERRYTDGGY